MAEKLATQKRLDMSIAFQNTLMETLNQRVSTRQQAIDLKVGTKIDLYNAKLAEAARKADEARQALAKADARLARTRLYAPTDSVVQQMAVTTVGQVVTTGQQLIVLTPIGGKLQVEARLWRISISVSSSSAKTRVIKIDAFPFTRFGALHGKVGQHRLRSHRRARRKTRFGQRDGDGQRGARGADRPRSTRKLCFSGGRVARRKRDENRSRDHPIDPGHDRHCRNPDRLPPRDRLLALTLGQNRI